VFEVILTTRLGYSLFFWKEGRKNSKAPHSIKGIYDL